MESKISTTIDSFEDCVVECILSTFRSVKVRQLRRAPSRRLTSGLTRTQTVAKELLRQWGNYLIDKQREGYQFLDEKGLPLGLDDWLDLLTLKQLLCSVGSHCEGSWYDLCAMRYRKRLGLYKLIAPVRVISWKDE